MMMGRRHQNSAMRFIPRGWTQKKKSKRNSSQQASRCRLVDQMLVERSLGLVYQAEQVFFFLKFAQKCILPPLPSWPMLHAFFRLQPLNSAIF